MSIEQIEKKYPELLLKMFESNIEGKAASSEVFSTEGIEFFTMFTALLYVPGFEIIAFDLLNKYKNLFSQDTPLIPSDILRDSILYDLDTLSAEHLGIIQELISRGKTNSIAPYKDYDGKNRIFLEFLLKDQHLPLLEWFVAKKAVDPNALYDFQSYPYYEKITPLMHAAYFGNIKVAEYLIESCHVETNSIVYKIGDNDHKFPLNAISFAKAIPIVNLLIDYGCPFLFTTVGLFEANEAYRTNYLKHVKELFEQDYFLTKSCSILAEYLESPEATNWNLVKEQWEKSFANYKKPKIKITEEELLKATSLTEQAVQEQPLLEASDDESIGLNALLESYFKAKNDFLKSEIAAEIMDNLQEGSWESIDFSKLHHFFFTHKQVVRQLENAVAMQKQDTEDYTWHVGEKEIHSSSLEVREVQTSGTFHGRLFCYLDNEKLQLGDKLTHGLEHLKVLTRGSKGENGVKILPKKGIITLKTRELGDDRPFAEGLFESDQDKCAFLVHFSDLTTHRHGLDLEAMGGHTDPC